MRRLAIILSLLLMVPASAGNQNWWGRQSVVIYPSNDVTTTNWTASGGGTFYTMVNDAANAANLPNGDGNTSYVTAPHNLSCTLLFDLTNSGTYAAANTKIRFVSIQVEAEKTSVGAAGSGTTNITLNEILTISSTDYSVGSVLVSVLDGYTKFTSSTRSYTNPATGLAWTASDVDGLQLKLTKTTTGNKYDLRVTGVSVAVGYDNVYDTFPTTRLHESSP